MSAATQRTLMTLSLPTGLVSTLNKEAESKHKSLDSFMEDILSKISFDEPNEDTAEAFKELQSGHYAGKLDMSSYSMFMGSVESIK